MVIKRKVAARTAKEVVKRRTFARKVTARTEHICEKCKVIIKKGEKCTQEIKGNAFRFYCIDCVR